MNFRAQTDILFRHNLCDFVKIPTKLLCPSMLEITTKSTYFYPAKKNMLILWIELQTNKNIEGFKTLHLNTVKNSKIVKTFSNDVNKDAT